MFTTLRMKLLTGLAPVLAIMVGLGLWAISMFFHLGGKIDMILRENYTSVRAAQGMKEAIERLDSAILFAIGGEEAQAIEQFHQYRSVFQVNLATELGMITLPGEKAMAGDLTSLFDHYHLLTQQFFDLGLNHKEARSKLYFAELLPTFNAIKDKADDVLELNQQNMKDESTRAREAAQTSIRMMVGALIGSALIASVVSLILSRSILEPIRGVTRGARAMARGDLDQVVATNSRDELGELAQAFNIMARTIREFREAGTARLLRAQKTAQATINSFPDPVVLVDTTGTVERANPAAQRILGVVPMTDTSIPWTSPPMLRPLVEAVLAGNVDHSPTSFDEAYCVRDEGQERFFLPRVLSIRENDTLLGAAIVLSDVTRFRLMDQLKSDMVSTVSHEFKTPLTGLQMSIHLLLEEIVGPLTAKQIELLIVARQDSDRLLNMVNDLLDLTRIEQGKLRLDFTTITPERLVHSSVEPLLSQISDAGIELKQVISAGLPSLRIDQAQVSHVFDNLIGNAVAHTERGGTITISAQYDETVDQGFVRFLVTDTGEGIPRDHLPRLFERFYRVPGTKAKGSAGLGLAIAREIIVAHGSKIDVTSEVGVGTTFAFSLPIAAGFTG